MNGVVVVEQLTGALHATLSFSPRFDRRYAKSDRMNLGALFFALQNFASNAIGGDGKTDDDTPAIQLFETSAERIAVASSLPRRLQVALFVRPVIKSTVATSIVNRMARLYDECERIDEQHTATSKQSARLLRQITESALQEEVSYLLRGLLTDLHRDSMQSRFVLVYYSPELARCGRESEEDEAVGGIKESHITPATTTSEQHEKRSKEQDMKTIKKLWKPPTRGKTQPKNNAVTPHGDPYAYHRLETVHATSRDAVGCAVQEQGFEKALVHTILPLLEVGEMLPNANTPGITQVATETTWKRFPLPDLTVVPTGHITTDIRIWGWKGCALVHTDHRPEEVEPPHIEEVLQTVRYLARVMVSITS